MKINIMFIPLHGLIAKPNCYKQEWQFDCDQWVNFYKEHSKFHDHLNDFTFKYYSFKWYKDS